MQRRKIIENKNRTEEWEEVKKEPYCFWGLIIKRWQWALLGAIILIIFVILLGWII